MNRTMGEEEGTVPRPSVPTGTLHTLVRNPACPRRKKPLRRGAVRPHHPTGPAPLHRSRRGDRTSARSGGERTGERASRGGVQPHAAHGARSGQAEDRETGAQEASRGGGEQRRGQTAELGGVPPVRRTQRGATTKNGALVRFTQTVPGFPANFLREKAKIIFFRFWFWKF